LGANPIYNIRYLVMGGNIRNMVKTHESILPYLLVC